MSKILKLSFLVFIFASCSSSDDESSTVKFDYFGPDVEWTGRIEESSFSLIESSAVGVEGTKIINGTIDALASEYLKFTVTTAENFSGVTEGDIVYAIQLQSYFLFIEPFETDQQPLILIEKGSCPVTQLRMNATRSKYTGAATLNSGADVFGRLEFDYTSGVGTLTSSYDLAYASLGAVTLNSGTCSSGLLEVDDGSGGTIPLWLNSSGAGLINSDGIYIALPFDNYNAADLDDEYIGFLFDDSNAGTSGDPKSIPIFATIASSGTAVSIGPWTNISTGVKAAASHSLTALTHHSPEIGLFEASVDEGGPSENIICQAIDPLFITGKKVILCSGLAPSDNSKLLSIIMISQ